MTGSHKVRGREGREGSGVPEPSVLERSLQAGATRQTWHPAERLEYGQVGNKWAKPRAVAAGPARRHPLRPSTGSLGQ